MTLLSTITKAARAASKANQRKQKAAGLSKQERIKRGVTKQVADQMQRLHGEQGDPLLRNQGPYNENTATMKVEGVSGMSDAVTEAKTHFPINDDQMPWVDQLRFNRNHQKLLQNDDGSPIFENMGLLFDRNARDPNKQGEGPGMWFDKQENRVVRNPTTEYEFQKTEPWRQNLAGDYAMAVMGQDGVAISDMERGLPKGWGQASIMGKPGTDLEASLARIAHLEKMPGLDEMGPNPQVNLANENVFGAPGAKGSIIGSTGDISPAEAQNWKNLIGDNVDMFHRPGGGDAYRAAEGWSYTSVADNLGGVIDSFLDRGMAKEFDIMLRQTAKQSVDAYRRMGNISRSNANPNFGIVWDHMLDPKNKGRMAHEIVKELIDKKIISMEEMNAIMQQFAPQQSQQPQGLLA